VKLLFLDLIQRPALLVDLQKADANIASMSAKAVRNKVAFRPHFKTHQSSRIAELFRKRGVSAITVSSVAMARYFADAGWQDILIAFPLNWREMDALNALAERVRLGVLVDCQESVEYLAFHVRHAVDVWIKIDTGLHRSGIWWQDQTHIETLTRVIMRSARLNFRGILTHAGQAYHAKSPQNVKELAVTSQQAMLAVKDGLLAAGFEDVLVSIGDTPGCRLIDDFSGVDEIRPGNFIFFDLEQWQLGACSQEEIAVAMACPIVSKNMTRNELVVYGGAIHFSKETMPYQGEPIYGLVAGEFNQPFGMLKPDCKVISTTQEHGVIAMDPLSFSQYRVGDVIQVFPVHSCLAAHLLGEYLDIHTGEKISTLVVKKDFSP